MSKLRAWRDDPSAPSEARALLAEARRSRPMTRAQRERSATRVARIAIFPAVTFGVFSFLKVVAAAAGLGAAGLVIVTAVQASHDAPPPAAGLPTTAEHARDPRPATPRSAPIPAEIAPAAAIAVTAAPSPTIADAPAPGSADAPSPPVAVMPAHGGAAALSPSIAVSPKRAIPPATVPVFAAARETLERSTDVPPSSAVAEPPSVAPRPDATPRAASALTRETELLESARAAMPGDPEAALRLVNRHESDFPRGALVAEREVLRNLALRRLGRNVEADARAKDLMRGGADSLYRPRLENKDAAPR